MDCARVMRGIISMAIPVIFDAAKDELFTAEKGAGAFMNDQRLRVSGRRHLGEALFATGIPFAGRGPLPAALQDLARLMPISAGVRRLGAASLDLAYVAAGRYDGYWERGNKPWDVAAGILFVTEAGGRVTTIENDGDPKTGASILASNTELHPQLRKVLQAS